MIDWFTVIAQIINFVILVALLKYLLYGRIVAAMQQREEEISASWAEAQHQRQAADRHLEEAAEERRRFDEQRELMLADVHQQVETYRHQLTDQVRTDTDELRARWADSIREQTDDFLRDLRRRAAEETFAIARRVLADLADTDLERQIVRQFMRVVESLDNDQRAALVTSLEEADHIAVVQTTYPLSADLQTSIRTSLRKVLLGDLELRFEQSPDLLCGIALRTNAHKLAWDLRDYFLALEEELRNTLDEETSSRRGNAATKAGGVHQA